MPFEFNVYSALLLPSFVQGVLFATLLGWRGYREDRLADRLLALLLLLFALRVAAWMLGFAGWYDTHDGWSTFMFYFPFTHWLAIGPLVYFYFRNLTNRDFRLRQADWWHFAPALLVLFTRLVVFVIDVVVRHWWQGQPFPDHFGTKGALADWPFATGEMVLQVLAYASLGYYFLQTRRAYRQYREYLDTHFSETDTLQFAWLRYFLYAVGIALLFWLGFDMAKWVQGKSLPYVLDWYSFFAWGVIIYYLSIAGYGVLPRQVLALHFEPALSTTPPVREPDAEALSSWRAPLIACMENERPYLQPELTLSELAAQLHVSPALLSRVINAEFGQNFNEFVNGYRVEAVKRLMLDPAAAHLSILGMAYECGFNSKATFNRAFQKHAGCSPSAFARTQKTGQGSDS